MRINLTAEVTDVPDGTYMPDRAENPDTDGTTRDYTLDRVTFKRGYAVGGYLGSIVIDPAEGVSKRAADSLPVMLAEAYAQGHYVGVWTDSETGKVYYDAVRFHVTRDSAMRAARHHGELAIWDMAADREIRVA